MIFQSLISFYERRSQEMPPYGYSIEDVGFVINLDKEGNLLNEPEDLRVKRKSNAYDYYKSIVPYTNQVNVRANAAAKTPNFMVDKADYVFGMSGKTKKDRHHESFKNLIAEVCEGSTDEGVRAVQSFLAKWNPDDSPKIEAWNEISVSATIKPEK
jgi:CRISPR-associated protein Csd1